MKRTQMLCFAGLITTTCQIYALDPTPGFYAGIMVGVSQELTTHPTFLSPFVDAQVTALSDYGQKIKNIINDYKANYPNGDITLSYNVFGEIGGQIGYRYDKYRLEAQLYYNSAPYKTFKISNGDKSVSLSDNSTQTNYMTGNTNTFTILGNLYFDVLPPDYIDSNFAPFIGIGGGYARVNNNYQFYVQDQQINNYRQDITQGAAAGQVMAGLLYFLDDFSNFALDFRFFSTANITPPSKYNIGTYNAQIASINLTFNGALNLG